MAPTLSGSRRMVGRSSSRFASRHDRALAREVATAQGVIGTVGGSSVDEEINLDAIGAELSRDLVTLRGDDAPSTGDPYTDRMRQDMTPNEENFVRATGVKQVASQLLAAMMDPRVPDIRVRGWLNQLWLTLRLRKREIQAGGFDTPSDVPLMLRAARSEAADNEAELRHLAEPNVARLKARIATLETEITDDTRLLGALRQRVAQMTLTEAK